MAISADFRVSASSLASYPAHPLWRSLPPPKVGFCNLFTGGSTNPETIPKWPCLEMKGHNMQCRCTRSLSFGITGGVKGHNMQCHCTRSLSFGITGDNKISPESINEETEGFLLNAINMSFFERLNLAWKILFPAPATRRSSNARIAKQRLKMILFSDRCAVSDDAKQKIVSNIVGALSDFVEIESRDKVQLSVSTDPDLGTVYSVTVPVRRVKPEHQYEDDYGAIASIEYKDTGESSGSVDVKFDFFIPNDKM